MSTINDTANGILLKAWHDAQAVGALCNGIKSNAYPWLVPGDVTDAVKVVNGGTVPALADLTYNTVDSYLSIPTPGTPSAEGTGIIRRAAMYQASDVALRFHFGTQTFRYAMAGYNKTLWDLVRNTDEWQTIRIGLHIYFDLLRIGLTATRISDMANLANSTTLVYGSAFTLIAPTTGDATDVTKQDYVVPTAIPGVMGDPLGTFQPLLIAIQKLYANMRAARQSMTKRLPLPSINNPNNSIPVFRWPCSNCKPAGSSTGDPPNTEGDTPIGDITTKTYTVTATVAAGQQVVITGG